MNTQGTHKPISDELLNSFIDGQITQEDRQEILALLEQDESLAKQVCELQRIKQMTTLAYDQIPPSRLPSSIIESPSRLPRIAAAVAIFCIGVLLGSFGLNISQSTVGADNIASVESKTRVLVHLTSSDSDTGLNTLNNLESMLQEFRHNSQDVEVLVVANGHGINLLRQGTTTVGDLIARLTNEYKNLSFAACKSTIDDIEIAEGAEVELIPQARLIESGIVEVIKLQQQGWTYIRG